MDDQTPHPLGDDNAQTPHLLGGDIVERLQKSGERPYCYCALFKGYAAEALEAADEIQRLRSVIDTLLNAINNAGPVPKHHIQVAAKHRKEWPTLWKAIDQLRDARDA